MSTKEHPKIVSAPIRMSPELMAKVTEACDRTGQKQAEILRLCLEIGIEDLRACNYDLPKLVADTARNLRTYVPKIALPFHGLVAAGSPVAPTDLTDETYAVAGNYNPKTHFVMRVNGQSMEPAYLDESYVICREIKDDEVPKSGTDVICSDCNGSYLKRLARGKSKWKDIDHHGENYRLESINPKFKDVVPDGGRPIKAVVVGKA